MTRSAVCLMGPTASGKTDIAVRLCERFPFDIISVDSALVYRGMNIGTAKPDAATLERAAHRLIDIRDPEEAYSAGDFVVDASAAMQDSFSRGRVPLLVGGTMMYFQALTRGIAALPSANAGVRAQIDAEAAKLGWPAMHRQLAGFDPRAAGRIEPNDSQRLQRAIEVYRISGKPISDWQAEGRASPPAADRQYVRIALQIADRKRLHARIEERLNLMLNNGFLDEMKVLYDRPGLTLEAASMRAVGYRQFWRHLAGECSFEGARYRALVATRQLAKRQMTWLRSDPEVFSVDPLEADVLATISTHLADKLA
jgi:tRNA dimethylallyltransferase